MNLRPKPEGDAPTQASLTPAKPAPTPKPPSPAEQRLRAKLDAAYKAVGESAKANGGARGKKVHLVADSEAWEQVLRLRAALDANADAEGAGG